MKRFFVLVFLLLAATVASANEGLAGKTIEFKDYTGDYGHEYEANTLEFSGDLEDLEITLKVNEYENFDIPTTRVQFSTGIQIDGDIINVINPVTGLPEYMCEIICIKKDIVILSFPDPLGDIKIFRIIN